MSTFVYCIYNRFMLYFQKFVLLSQLWIKFPYDSGLVISSTTTSGWIYPYIQRKDVGAQLSMVNAGIKSLPEIKALKARYATSLIYDTLCICSVLNIWSVFFSTSLFDVTYLHFFYQSQYSKFQFSIILFMKICCTKIATLINKKTENYPLNIHSYHYDSLWSKKWR